MQSTQKPTLIPLAFAANGTKNAIPEASQIGITDGAASLNDGFPPLTMTPIAAGGKPPSGADMNGVLNLLSQSIRWQHAGGQYAWNSTFVTDTNVAGYPAGAHLMRADGTGFWINTADNNETNPDATDGSAANWVPGYNYGVTTITGLTNANVTLEPLQAAKSKITLAGALTGNIQIIFPAWTKEWQVVNNTTGSYAITAKTAAGTGVILASGQQKITGDGTNITQPFENATNPPQFDNSTKLATTAYVVVMLTGKNRIFNARFRINQRGYASGAALSSGVYGFDRWKSSAANSSMTFTAAPQGQQVTISGSFQQVIEQANIEAGTYMLSWSGTAQGRVYNSGASAPAYATSPIAVTLDGTQNVIVEFEAGTLDLVQLEKGGNQTNFDYVDVQVDLARCQRYYQADEFHCGAFPLLSGSASSPSISSTSNVQGVKALPVVMRATPTLTFQDLAGNIGKYTIWVASNNNNQTMASGGLSANETYLDMDATSSLYAASWCRVNYTLSAEL